MSEYVEWTQKGVASNETSFCSIKQTTKLRLKSYYLAQTESLSHACFDILHVNRTNTKFKTISKSSNNTILIQVFQIQ